MKDNITISYDLDTFMKYKELNHMLPAPLKPLCNDIGGSVIIRDILLKDVTTVIDSFMNGKNPNDMILKNSIIENLNKISDKNYDQILTSLKSLNYVRGDHFETLISDILIRAMNDTPAIKLDLGTTQRCQSDLLSDIVLEFFPLSIKEDNGTEVKFSLLFLKQCQKYFLDFTNPMKPLDLNNLYRVDHYKGFLNFLGILFKNKVLSYDITISCLTKLKDLMFNTQWGQIEAENLYEGYKKLTQHIYYFYDRKDSYGTEEIYNKTKKFINDIKNIHESIKQQNEKINKLKNFTKMYHRDFENKINSLLSKIEKYKP